MYQTTCFGTYSVGHMCWLINVYPNYIQILKHGGYLFVPSGLKLSNSRFCPILGFLYVSKQKSSCTPTQQNWLVFVMKMKSYALCNINQRNAHFSILILQLNFSIFDIYMFRNSGVHPQGDSRKRSLCMVCLHALVSAV